MSGVFAEFAFGCPRCSAAPSMLPRAVCLNCGRVRTPEGALC